MIALATLRVRLELATLRVRLELAQRNPQLLIRGLKAMADEKKPPLKIKMPIELAGLKSRMVRAEAQERRIGAIGKRYDAVQEKIDEQIGAHEEHAGALEIFEHELRRKIEGMVGSNGADPLDDGAGRGSADQAHQVGQVIEGTKES